MYADSIYSHSKTLLVSSEKHVYYLGDVYTMQTWLELSAIITQSRRRRPGINITQTCSLGCFTTDMKTNWNEANVGANT